MIFGLFENWAQALEVIGVWLAAVATLITAYVALNIANRANRQNIKVTARPMLEVTVGGGLPNPIFHVSATNLGNRTSTVVHLGAQSLLRNSNSFVLATGTQGSSPMPSRLGDGETAHWRFPEITPDGRSWYDEFALHFAKQRRVLRWISLNTFRFLVVTSLGNTFLSKPSKEFRKKVLEQMSKETGR